MIVFTDQNIVWPQTKQAELHFGPYSIGDKERWLNFDGMVHSTLHGSFIAILQKKNSAGNYEDVGHYTIAQGPEETRNPKTHRNGAGYFFKCRFLSSGEGMYQILLVRKENPGEVTFSDVEFYTSSNEMPNR